MQGNVQLHPVSCLLTLSDGCSLEEGEEEGRGEVGIAVKVTELIVSQDQYHSLQQQWQCRQWLWRPT